MNRIMFLVSTLDDQRPRTIPDKLCQGFPFAGSEFMMMAAPTNLFGIHVLVEAARGDVIPQSHGLSAGLPQQDSGLQAHS